jgi:hypothetical protein
VIQGAGRWAVRRSRVTYAGFGIVLAGECWLTVDGHETLRLAAGDFVLIPASRAFTTASDLACEVVLLNAQEALACQAGEVRYGNPDLEVDFKMLRRCPMTDRNFSSGINIDRDSFRVIPQTRIIARCPYCGQNHTCRPNDASLMESTLPSETPPRLAV